MYNTCPSLHQDNIFYWNLVVVRGVIEQVTVGSAFAILTLHSMAENVVGAAKYDIFCMENTFDGVDLIIRYRLAVMRSSRSMNGYWKLPSTENICYRIASATDGLSYGKTFESKRRHRRRQQLNQVSAVLGVHSTLMMVSSAFVTKKFRRNLLII